MGFPCMSERGFPGNLVDLYLAGITATTLLLEGGVNILVFCLLHSSYFYSPFLRSHPSLKRAKVAFSSYGCSDITSKSKVRPIPGIVGIEMYPSLLFNGDDSVSVQGSLNISKSSWMVIDGDNAANCKHIALDMGP